MKFRVSLVIVTLLAAGSAIAQKTYRPEELQGMIRNGNYPNQGPVSTQSQPIGFTLCKQKIASVINSIGPKYPSKIVVDSSLMYMHKLWTNDAAMAMTCSNLDNKLVITTAPYL